MRKKKFTEKEALEIAFENLKPSLIPIEEYNKFRSYRNRYNKGKLKKDAVIKLLEYFGFTANTIFIYDEKKDNSK